MAVCKFCNQPFRETKPWQAYCCYRHQQDWHLHQRRLAYQQRTKLKGQGNGHAPTPEQQEKLKPWIDNLPAVAKKPKETFNLPLRRRKLKGQGDGTPEQRKQAKEELAQIVEKYRDERQPKLVRRI